jgi:hypothetical protein
MLGMIAYKKEYLESYIFLLEQSNNQEFGIPLQLKYDLAIHILELTKNIQQQYTRFMIFNRSCKNII